MNGIGSSPPRPDGWAKVSGAALYADDLEPSGLWFGATVRSPHAHAVVSSIRYDPSVVPEAVFVTAGDLPAVNGIQLLDDSWPILADRLTRHVGEPVALVAAPSRLDALRAARAVSVEYETQTAVFSLEDAETLPPHSSLSLGCGDVDRALASAASILDGEYRTGHQEHIYIECQTMTAWFDGETVVAEGSMQCPYYIHKALVHAFGLPAERVRVLANTVGGGFGGKEDFPSALAIHAALLARACGHPVRLAYDRHEDIVATTKRHPARVRIVSGVDRQGALLGLDIDIVLDGGAYNTLSPVVLSRAALHAAGPYRCPNVRVQARALRTHTAPNGAFRGFGAPQVQFAIERHMDGIARAVGCDPFEIRLRNALEPGDRLPTGQVLDASTAARACLEEVERRTGFRKLWREAEDRRRTDPAAACRGVGLSLFFHGAGFTGNGERNMQSPVGARLLDDGRIEVLTAMTDMGQGCVAIFPQIAIAAGGFEPDDVVFAPPDTALVPDSGPTVASRTTMIVGGLIAQVASEMAERVFSWWRSSHSGVWMTDENGRLRPLGVTFREAARKYRQEVGGIEITRRNQPPAWQEFDDSAYRGAAYPTFSWGADVVELEVDRDTLAVMPTRVTSVCEVGRVIHPVLCAGQIEGGTLQALGYALLEEVKMEHGRYLNDRLATYIIPTIQDTPPIAVHLLERPWEGGPFGAKGVGELPMDGGAPAVAQAIENASGLIPNEIPATPERLLGWQRSGRCVEAAR
ncbi:MAG: xanthine dehydrogenase family protein molybdopterin-binding subunit [Acidobacteriota bacterium]